MLRWGWVATVAAVYVWDYEACLAIAARGAQLARDSGALEVLAVALNIMGQAVTMGGDFATAGLLVAEADAVNAATGSRTGPYVGLVLAAFRGHESEVAELIEAITEDATARGQGTIIQYTHYAKAVVMNGLGRYDEAVVAAIAASDATPELVVSRWALGELVEAASRTGDPSVAVHALARLGEHTRGSDADWALGIEARSRALLTDGDAAERLYRDAIDHLGRTALRPELARAHLLYGEWLRRANRRVDAREQLQLAHGAFLAMGANAFTERARRELSATGAKVRKRVDETRDELTPQEEHIARLARDGRTNTQIGSELYLSPRTVEWHLRKVFAKLGIRSRRELWDALPRGEQLRA
jgi:DNA-binding CsgD family transcriptional regulator